MKCQRSRLELPGLHVFQPRTDLEHAGSPWRQARLGGFETGNRHVCRTPHHGVREDHDKIGRGERIGKSCIHHGPHFVRESPLRLVVTPRSQ